MRPARPGAVAAAALFVVAAAVAFLAPAVWSKAPSAPVPASTRPAVSPSPGGAQKLPRYVPGPKQGVNRIQFADSLVSINDECPVKGGALSLSLRPVYVNGQPIGFC